MDSSREPSRSPPRSTTSTTACNTPASGEPEIDIKQITEQAQNTDITESSESSEIIDVVNNNNNDAGIMHRLRSLLFFWQSSEGYDARSAWYKKAEQDIKTNFVPLAESIIQKCTKAARDCETEADEYASSTAYFPYAVKHLLPPDPDHLPPSYKAYKAERFHGMITVAQTAGPAGKAAAAAAKLVVEMARLILNRAIKSGLLGDAVATYLQPTGTDITQECFIKTYQDLDAALEALAAPPAESWHIPSIQKRTYSELQEKLQEVKNRFSHRKNDAISVWNALLETPPGDWWHDEHERQKSPTVSTNMVARVNNLIQLTVCCAAASLEAQHKAGYVQYFTAKQITKELKSLGPACTMIPEELDLLTPSRSDLCRTKIDARELRYIADNYGQESR